MARNVSTADLITRIRARGDVRSNRHPDATLTDWMDESYAELYDLLVSANPDWFMDTDTVSVVSGTASYALPTTLHTLVGVSMPIGSISVPVRRFNYSERTSRQTGPTDKQETRYRMKGSNIIFKPTPNFSATVTLDFIPVATLIADISGNFDGINGWEEYIVADVCMKAAMSDEEDYRPFATLKASARARIMDMAPTRDSNEPDTVRDVDAEVDVLYRYF
jgi:hypothetical protein